MNKSSRIYVAGHRGLVGSAIVRRLEAAGYADLITHTSRDLNLINQQDVASFFAQEKPEYVFLAAAKVGGIHANDTYRAEFIYNNLMIQTNVMHHSYLHGVKRLLFLGSSCIYPKLCLQPMKEAYLMTGPLEQTNSPYAVAKIAGIEMCWAYNKQYGTKFIPVMPTNLYGGNDNFDLEHSHVLPALIRKCHLAKMASAGNLEAIDRDVRRFGPLPADIRKALGLNAAPPDLNSASVTVWGTGTPKREFLHVDDMAAACVHLLCLPDSVLFGGLSDQDKPLFNIGTGVDCTIAELAEIVKGEVGFHGALVFDGSKPDGAPQKLLDVSMINQLGWQASISLRDGIGQVYRWYERQVKSE